MEKFVDDTYLMVPAVNSSSCNAELTHIDRWSLANNLKLNRVKSSEIIFVSKRSRDKTTTLPAEITDVPRVKTLVILGVTISYDLSFKNHIDQTLSSCAQSLHAIRTLRARGLHDHIVHKVYQATVVSKLIYASPAWHGFLSASERLRLEACIRKAIKLNFCSTNQPSFEQLLDNADSTLFNKILTNSHHVLHRLLPPKVDHHHNLRHRAHDFKLPAKTFKLLESNFFYRMLYKGIY